MRPYPKITLLISLFLLPGLPSGATAWGPEGHAAIGIMAIELTDELARDRLKKVLGSIEDARIDELCNWPDAIRDQHEWDWAAPQHYVNIPRNTSEYAAQRDCRDGLCVTEAVKKYAGELANDQLPGARREQAFAWLCHLVGDMHQPLHCGYADDRGGNAVEVVFEGEPMPLHQFWDRQLILSEVGSLPGLLAQSQLAFDKSLVSQWNPDEVNDWTNESHELVARLAYPTTPEIDEAFAARSWSMIQQRLPAAAERLARILNATLGEGEVLLER